MNIFNAQYIDSKRLFTQIYNVIPCIIGIGGVNNEKFIAELTKNFQDSFLHTYYYHMYKDDKKETANFMSCFPMKDGVMIVMEHRFLSLYFKEGEEEKVKVFKDLALKYRDKDKVNNFEINLIIQSGGGLELSPMEIVKKRLDLKLNYEDDFVEIDTLIRKRLNKQNDKGIVLLHGLPGTGKTTYLRYLIGKMKKRVMFLPPGLASSITNPDFITVLVDYPNSVLIIEDAENIITDRKESRNSVVSNLLNLSDGLLADCLSTQIICTFNMPLTSVDEALLRKGRLIARYEFKKLSVDKSQKLSEHLGYDANITEPMSLSEIYNLHDKNFLKERKKAGFTRA